MNASLVRRLWLLGGILAALWLGLWAWSFHQASGRAIPPTPTLAPWVYLYVDGRRMGPLRLPGRTPREVLRQSGLEMKPTFQVWVNGQPWEPDRPLPSTSPLLLRVVTEPQEVEGQVMRGTTGRIPPELWGKGATMVAEDETPSLASGSWEGADGLRTLYAAASFVGEALAQHGLAPQGFDRVLPEEEAPWPVEAPLRRVRITEDIVLEQETIPFDAKYAPLPDEPIDTLKVVHPGTVGIKAKEVLVRYEDGEEVARIPLGEWVLQPPQPRIIGYGTKITIQTLDTPDGPIQYWRAVRVYATSYSPCRVYGYGGPCDDITASGERLRKGIIAVRLSWYKYMKGMRVYVPGYGFGIIADVGGGLGDRLWIDLGFSEEDYESWARWTTLYFLAPPPPPDRILWILPP